MKLTQLEYFCVAARYHNITRASKELFVTQPSVSNAIKALEEEFGVNLFYRNNNKLTLTPEGEKFYQNAEELLAHADAVRSELHELRKQITPVRIGIPPMLALAKALKEEGAEVSVVLGYRDGDLFLKKEFEPYADVYVSTEDGSVGTRGNVIDAIRENGLDADTIYACGPMPMLRGVKAYAAEKETEAQISLEERMACGIGACLGCVCNSTDVDSHSHVHNKRVCKDGPVFNAEDVTL